MDYSAVEEAFIDLSLEAGSLILDAFDAPELETIWKDDGTPVTVADMEADELIRRGLEQAFPDVLVVSEENADSHTASAGRFFIVDPLDGTSGFRRGKREFTVNIALIENGKPVQGVVHAPALGRHFCTSADGTVIERRLDPGQSTYGIAAEHYPVLRDNSGLRVVASRTLKADRRVAELLERYDVASVEAVSSSIKFCLMAANEADFYPRLGRTMEWDTAAGHAILAASGGWLHRRDDGCELEYGKQGYENPEFLAGSPGVLN